MITIEHKMYSDLYDKKDKEILKTAEDSLNPKLDRVDEIIAYSKKSGIKRIGIAYCTAFNKETAQLENIMIAEGFIVEKVNCKLGRIPFNQLIPDYKGISCNPAGQADYLASKKTELNIMMGLCLGHDMIFNSKSKAPVTPLIVKDRKLKHQTINLFKTENN